MKNTVDLCPNCSRKMLVINDFADRELLISLLVPHVFWFQNQKITPRRTWPAANHHSQSIGTQNALQAICCMYIHRDLENRRL